jgi:hypothetical protein
MATVIVGTNSWATIAEADLYLDAKYGAAAWAPLSVADKSALLISACRWIRNQAIFSIALSSTSQVVKDAQCEAAWYLYKYGEAHWRRSALYASGVRDFQVSKWSETLEAPAFPENIAAMLSDSITGAGHAFPTVTRPLS